MFAFLFFGFLWMTKFLSDQSKYITMVSASTYYFNNRAGEDGGDHEEGSADVSMALNFAWVKNVGSIAYGSLILTLITILKTMIDAAA